MLLGMPHHDHSRRLGSAPAAGTPAAGRLAPGTHRPARPARTTRARAAFPDAGAAGPRDAGRQPHPFPEGPDWGAAA
jgi:hypothetical protein